ncbi:FAD-dependent oxidoreductase [Clostridium manihotivorum]|uniref:FAD-dependent oxidoreductase n=1 Tax=Clostridium manihotivorum TaxID=2320868 RepID=A0A410DMN6_9CLOT|nr:FAD-dependent oxidoreductase [Clostridium manihotivorum]QAA30341.1 FAD-dependent oxidoreductase [Clostridium manihotivorum]
MSNNNMDVFLSNHEPYWIASVDKTEYPALAEDINVDVAIIGGGMVGITSAFLLKRRGFKVAILEVNNIAHGTTGHTTAKITSQHGLIYDKITKSVGHDKARKYAEANEHAIHFIADLIKEKNIDCDFEEKQAYIYTQSDEYIKKIENEVKAASNLGIKATYLDKAPLPFDTKAAVRFDNQAQFHPLKYLLALAKDIPGDGSSIFEHTKVVDVDDSSDKCIVKTDDGKKVFASKVIVASHFPCYDGLGLYFARMHSERSYAIGVKSNVPSPDGMFITAEKPLRSIRSQRFDDGEILIIAGEHHKTGAENKTNVHYDNLGKFAKDNFNLQSVLYRWSTQDCITIDNLPYVGLINSNTSRVFVATGFGKWGMTNSTAAAIIITDLIADGKNKWQEVYSPSRFDISSVPKIVETNLDVAKNLIKGKLEALPEELEVKNGEAKVVKVNGERLGAYRDEDGNLHVVNTTCTHLGCELEWNEAEKTWDCPCHGSRFNYDGDNVEGPAFNKLGNSGEIENKVKPDIF